MNRKQRRAAQKGAHAATPHAVDAHPAQAPLKLAESLIQQGRFDAAMPLLLHVLQLDPRLPDAWNDLGLISESLNKTEEAIAHYTRALYLQPNFAIAHFNLCRLLQLHGRLLDALPHGETVVRLHPGFALGHIQLGTVLFGLGRLSEAMASASEALRLSPEQPDALELLGNVLHRLGRDEEALEACRRAMASRPGSPGLLRNLGQMLQIRGRPDEAIEAFAESTRLDPDSLAGWLQLAHTKLRAADWVALDRCERKARECLRAGRAAAPPFLVILTLNSTASEQLLAARNWARQTYASIAPFPARPPEKTGPIRIGYLSADFHAHATAALITGVFESHDRARFQTFAYAIGPDDGSPYRRHLRQAVDNFTDLTGLSHEQAARRIRADQIDILVDLNGYAGETRTQILAYRPAPIQVNYLGYPGTMGASFIDYILADRIVTPPAVAPFFTEKLVYLPHCYQPNMHRPIAQTTDTRADHLLPDQGFVFCCFNQIQKITPALFTIWMRLLREVPDSVLWLLSETEFTNANLKREASTRGIDPSRLVFGPKLPMPDHLARHKHADLFLDTLPYCAHTTASDALWSGLPLMSCMGETFVSRVSGSLLMAMGLHDLVTTTLAEYEALALHLAREAASLARLRQQVSAARSSSPLFDTHLITRHIESAFATMWQRHQTGAAPESFAVDAQA
jgi:predicted O-linked N-acetylglucosamine transferase (SPINDLY family)